MERRKTPIILTGRGATFEDRVAAAALMGVDLYAELAKDRPAVAKRAKLSRRTKSKSGRVSRSR
jgi:hypothetical protein